MEQHFIELNIANFSGLEKGGEEQCAEDVSYNRVLQDLGVAVETEREVVLICDLPLFVCLVDINDIHSVSPLYRDGSIGYCQIDYKDSSRAYAKVEWLALREVLAEVATIHIP